MRLAPLVALLVACAGGDTDTDTDTDIGTDVAVPLDGFGTITGDCGPLSATELSDAAPHTYVNALDLPAGFDDEDLSPDGQEIVDEGNLNDSSLYSEVFAFEVLHRCEEALLLRTEAEVTYEDPNGKKTDLVVDIEGVRVGVSVARAVGWPRDDPYTVDEATDLLEDKLSDVPIAADNATEVDAWDRSILHVIAYSPDHADSVETALDGISSAIRGDTIVFVTATNGEDGFIYGDD